MLGRFTREMGIVALTVLTGCGAQTVCIGEVGPETIEVDASALADDPGVTDVEVCIVENGDDEAARTEHCSEPGNPTVALTTQSSDYPSTVEYYVDVQSGSAHVFPDSASGTVEMQCTATTTRIVLTDQE